MSNFIEVKASKNSLANRRPIYGVGINDADYVVQPRADGKQTVCPYYKVWVSMLKRCYDKKYHQERPTYIECSVTEKWLVFSAFRGWMVKQSWQGMELDKDIKIIGNKLYSPECCIFVSRQINSLLVDCASSRGEWPIGVSFHKLRNKYTSHCCRKGKLISLGYHITPEAAHSAWRVFKNKVILEAANQPENDYIRQYLINHAGMLSMPKGEE